MNNIIKKYQLGSKIQLPPSNPLKVGNFDFLNPLHLNYKDDVLNQALPIIKKFEQFRSKPYIIGGQKTIGYGLTSSEYVNKKSISEPEAEQATKKYISEEILPTLKKKSYYNNLNPNQKSALTSLIYNIGKTKFNSSSKLQNALNKKDWLSAAKEMNHGVNDTSNPGLKIRRKYEQDLFLGKNVDKFLNGGKLNEILENYKAS